MIVPTIDKYRPLAGRRRSLEDIGAEVLKLGLKKNKGFNHKRWGWRHLDPCQVDYATIDAFLSYEIANKLQINGDYRFM